MFDKQSVKLAGYALWPFGDARAEQHAAQRLSVVGNVLWFVLAGWWLALEHSLVGAVLCLTIIAAAARSSGSRRAALWRRRPERLSEFRI